MPSEFKFDSAVSHPWHWLWRVNLFLAVRPLPSHSLIIFFYRREKKNKMKNLMGSSDKEREIIYWLPSWAKQTQLRGLFFFFFPSIKGRVRCLKTRKETDTYPPLHFFFPGFTSLFNSQTYLLLVSNPSSTAAEGMEFVIWGEKAEAPCLFCYFVCEVKSKSYCVIYFITKVVELPEWEVIS